MRQVVVARNMEKLNINYNAKEEQIKFKALQRVTCLICYLPFDDTEALTPRLLHCGHTFCQTCLGKLSKGSKIECPLDRDPTSIQNGGVSGLKKNYALIDSFDQEEDSVDCAVSILGESQSQSDRDDIQESDDIEPTCSTCCSPPGHQSSHAFHSIALMILMTNLFFDWFIVDHVDRVIIKEALDYNNNSQPFTESNTLKAIHIFSLNWVGIKAAFKVLTVCTTVIFAILFIGTLISWSFMNDHRMAYQKCIMWLSLWLNDLPQSILVTVVVYATTDAYIPYIVSTSLGVLGQYIIFYALSNTKMFHYPKLLYCHMFLTAICFILQAAHISKAHVVD